MKNYIDPKTLARIKDMPLIAKSIAEGFLYGLQSSRQKGVGIEFNQYRSYEPGDSLARIDWKLFARSDRYFVREAERESEINVWFLLDASYSMQYQSVKKNPTDWNKLEYAKHLIASLAYIAQKQGDSVGLMGLSSESLFFLPNACGEKHWQKLLQKLSVIKPGRYFPQYDFIKNKINQLQKKSLIFLISDFYQQQQEVFELVKNINTIKSDVIAVQLTCDDELNFNYKGNVRFKDFETEKEVIVAANYIKEHYLAEYQNHQEKLEKKLLRHHINYINHNIDEPLDKALFEFLKIRNRQGLI